MLEAAAGLDPEFLPVRDNLKWVRIRMGEEQAAFADYLEVVRLEGGGPDELAALARLHADRGWEGVLRDAVEGMQGRAAEGSLLTGGEGQHVTQ